jgi:hypothetical protein
VIFILLLHSGSLFTVLRGVVQKKTKKQKLLSLWKGLIKTHFDNFVPRDIENTFSVWTRRYILREIVFLTSMKKEKNTVE